MLPILMSRINDAIFIETDSGLKNIYYGAYNNQKKLKFWNLPYLVANTYGLNFIKIGGMSTFHRGQGGTSCPLCAPYQKVN